MYRDLETVRLKDGTEVQAGVVVGPDTEWADRVEELLSHKGSTWRWGNEMAMRHDLGIDCLYYILHRDGEPFANMMNIEFRGVGLFGHVFTKPDERQNGAASALMPLLMDDFRSRGGQMLLLGTGYDSHPYHLYAKNGFVGLEPTSGYMAYYADSEDAFYRRWFTDGEAVVEQLTWRHWPGAIPLFSAPNPVTVRSMGMRATGRYSVEGPMIPMLEDEHVTRPKMGLGTRTAVLEIKETGAVAGLASYGRNPLWRGAWTVDLFCHPDHWDRGRELYEAMEIQPAERLLAYCDAGFEPKEKVLREVGFEPLVTYKDRVAVDHARTRYVDVTEWEKRG